MKSVKEIVKSALTMFRSKLLTSTITDGDITHALSIDGAYDLQRQINELNSSISYIGMIIHSTTLDTMQKVIDVYGGTTWIEHSGYVLRGANSNVVAGSAKKTSGNDNAIVPYHNHTFTGTSKNYTSGGMSSNKTHSHTCTIDVVGKSGNASVAGYVPGSNNFMYYKSGTTITNSPSIDHTHTTTVKPEGSISYAGSNGNTTNANIPNYKSVYIWERTQ